MVQPNITTRSLAASDFSVKRQKKVAWRDSTQENWPVGSSALQVFDPYVPSKLQKNKDGEGCE